jgi:hypothetical protein
MLARYNIIDGSDLRAAADRLNVPFRMRSVTSSVTSGDADRSESTVTH